jgi:hypothetical protein
MGWVSRVGVLAPLALLAVGAGAPSAKSITAPGLWEVTGAPGSTKPIRQCLADTRALAQFEHRGQPCPRTVLSDSETAATIQYNCARAGFGTSRITVITPRALRIETQGISDGLPFNYVIQARRVGNCSAH